MCVRFVKTLSIYHENRARKERMEPKKKKIQEQDCNRFLDLILDCHTNDRIKAR